MTTVKNARTRITLVAAVSLVAVVLLIGCSPSKNLSPSGTKDVVVMAVQRGDLTEDILSAGK